MTESDVPHRRARFRPPAVPQVKIAGFWGPRIDAVAERTVHVLFDRALASGALEQIDPALPVPPLRIPFSPGHGLTMQMFWDSDFGKIIETAAYTLSRRADAALEARVDSVIDAYARLQADDGYLNSWFLRMQPGLRWTNLRDCHELYNMGHLIEAAVAYFEATGKRILLDVMRRCMDHVIATLGPLPGQKRGYCGHPEIELALVKLARATGEWRYLDLAKYFIDERGASPHYFDEEARARGSDPTKYHFRTHEYSQSHKPVREQERVVGHAVRAMYLYSGMADIATEFDDDGLVAALERLWAHLTTRNLYVTGGLGPSRANEGFTSDYDLPNETAYAETCASVALIFWASRMLGRGPDRRFADVMEQALYNGALSGLSLDGTRFFYENPLESHGRHHRWLWHACPCCPPNIARLVASVGAYMYGLSEDEVAVHLYGESEAALDVAGIKLGLRQQTRYPWSDEVKLTLGLDRPSTFTLSLRIPAWAGAARLSLNDESIQLSDLIVRGYARLTRLWRDGDQVTLDLDMQVQALRANPRVRQDLGQIALRRGPLIYCLEGVDNEGGFEDTAVLASSRFACEPAPDLCDGAVAITFPAFRQDWGADLYRVAPPAREPINLRAIPYFAWDNRAHGAMRVWLNAGDAN